MLKTKRHFVESSDDYSDEESMPINQWNRKRKSEEFASNSQHLNVSMIFTCGF